MKCGTSSVVGIRPQPAAMRLHDGTADGQSHAAALRLGGKERRKDLIHLLRWHPTTGTPARELSLTAFSSHFHRKLPPEAFNASMPFSLRVNEHLLYLERV